MPRLIFSAYAKMAGRIEAERKLAQVNLAFATEGMAMEQMDRDRFLGELQLAARGSHAPNAIEEIADAGTHVIREEGTVPGVEAHLWAKGTTEPAGALYAGQGP